MSEPIAFLRMVWGVSGLALSNNSPVMWAAWKWGPSAMENQKVSTRLLVI
jgi:hypothetical protein